MRPNIQAELRYRSFLLNPDLPSDGVNRADFIERKFGSLHHYERIIETVTLTGKAEGINFALDKIQRTPNSANSHRILRLAQNIGAQEKAIEVLFSAYFERGLDIGDTETLTLLADEIGLNKRSVTEHLNSEDGLNAIYNENARLHRMGITGVPSYIFNSNQAIAGAQEPEILTRLIDMAVLKDTEHPILQSTR